MRVLLINGSIGAGKTWTVLQLKSIYRDRVRLVDFSFKDPLMKAVPMLLGVPEMPYEQFKTTEFHGLTGREWIIRIATNCRDVKSTFFADAALLAAKQESDHNHGGRPTIHICDSFGFEDEWGVCVTDPDVTLLSASIERPGDPPRGEQYPNDSRYNLAHKCAIVAADSNVLLTKLQAAMQRRGWV